MWCIYIICAMNAKDLKKEKKTQKTIDVNNTHSHRFVFNFAPDATI